MDGPSIALGATEEATAGLSVLVIEDDANVARSYEILLGLFGHRVTVAADGETAVRVAAEVAPDVALIDIGLPRLDGYRVAAQIRAQSESRRPLLVAVTGYGRDEDRMRSREAGIDLHLTKPVDPEVLRRLLRRFERVIAHTVASCRPRGVR
jgi:CheY-like chemotaxis protein